MDPRRHGSLCATARTHTKTLAYRAVSPALPAEWKVLLAKGRMRPFALFFLASALMACGSSNEPEEPAQAGAVTTESASWVQLGEGYRFCLAPAEAPEETKRSVDDAFVKMPLPNLESVRTLLNLADLSYRAPTEIGPAFERLGFGREGEGAELAACAEDAEKIQAKGEAGFAETGACATAWRTAHPRSSAADFVRWTQAEVHPARTLEFFSEGYKVGADGKFVSGSTQLVWAQHRSEPWVVIAFRGTEFPDADDLWTDANFPKKPFLDGKAAGFGRVHGGFADAYATVRPLIDQRLRMLPPGTRIWITGHSLGGALASLLGAEVLSRIAGGQKLTFGGMTTFGSPRVGDDTFFRRTEALAIQHHVALHRVQNVSNDVLGFDPIVHVPFRNVFSAFGHVGAPLQFYPDGNLEYALRTSRNVPPAGLLESAVAAFKERVGRKVSEAFPHALLQYRTRLERSMKLFKNDLRECGPRR